MSDKFKSTLLWTCYAVMVIVVLFTLVFLIVDVLAPTFFPEVDISGMKQYINTFCVILSFMSVVLGVYSIWQSNGSSKQANEILQSVQAIEREQHLSQGLMHVITSVVDNGTTIKTTNANKDNLWKPDCDVT